MLRSNAPLFRDSKTPERQTDGQEPAQWKVMIVDDDKSTHDVTYLVFEDFSYDGRKLKIVDGYSGADVRRLMEEHPDTAVLLLDVVMETETAGLDAVKYIRETLKNEFVRIILRTGQPGLAPEKEVITQYDINDYKDKSDLTALKLNTSMIVALRSYQGLKRIQKLAMSNETLEQLVKERTLSLRQINRRLKTEVRQRAESEARLGEAQRIARIGNWEWRIPTDRMIWSDQIYHIVGLDVSRVAANRSTLLNLTYPDDRAELESIYRKAIEEKTPFFSLEHRIVKPDGSVSFVCQQGEVDVDERGAIIRVAGTLQDITERHQAEETMRKLSLAVEQTADSIMITDREGIIEYVNPAFETITGYSKTEAIGKHPNILKSGKLGEAFYRRLWKKILAGKVFSDVVINRRSDGGFYYEEKTITPQRDSRGEITHFISTGKDITDRVEAQQKLHYLAHHDALTGLPNRVLLQDRLDQAIPRMRWHKRNIGVLFIDLDRFKLINDSLGHDVGDLLLQEAAERLGACVREGDTVARLGGDEFAIILNDIASRKDVLPVVHKLGESLAEPFIISERELFVSASIGISLFPNDGKDTTTLLKMADIAMYRAKANGGCGHYFYSDESDSIAAERLSLEAKLRRALDRGEFSLHYQPQLNLNSYKTVAREALLRWSHPDFSGITPTQFVPLLEETGLIIPVGEWVLRAACLDEMIRLKSGLAPQRVAVNLSIRQFRQRDFVQMVEAILSETGISPEQLELEVTEGLLISNVSDTAGILHELHELGVMLSIDDFGTGYSSMNYLKRLPFDSLKIDRSFIRDITHNTDDAAIASAIITLAHSMDLEVVAEGVENVEQLVYLHNRGCDIIQGYLCSPPVAFEDTAAFEQIGAIIREYLACQKN